MGGIFDITTWKKFKNTIYYNNINTDTKLMKTNGNMTILKR